VEGNPLLHFHGNTDSSYIVDSWQETIKLDGTVAFTLQQGSSANAPQCNIVRTLYIIINIII